MSDHNEQPLQRPTLYATCTCGIEIIQVKDEFWAAASNGREVCKDGHWHKPNTHPRTHPRA